MLKIYGALNSRAYRNVWMALELGLPFDFVPVVQASRLPDPFAADAPLNTASESFRKIAPAGRVPVVEDDGLVLHESLAINLHLARKTTESPLAPRDAREDAEMTMWTLWAATTCEPHTIPIIINRTVRYPEDRDETAVRRAIAALDAPLRWLAQSLEAGGGHPVGRRFTVADLNIAEVLRYGQPASELMDGHPVVRDWLAACQSRPAFLEVAAMREAEVPPPHWRDAYRPVRDEVSA